MLINKQHLSLALKKKKKQTASNSGDMQRGSLLPACRSLCCLLVCNAGDKTQVIDAHGPCTGVKLSFCLIVDLDVLSRGMAHMASFQILTVTFL